MRPLGFHERMSKLGDRRRVLKVCNWVELAPSDFRSLRELEGVFGIDAKVTDRAYQRNGTALFKGRMRAIGRVDATFPSRESPAPSL